MPSDTPFGAGITHRVYHLGKRSTYHGFMKSIVLVSASRQFQSVPPVISDIWTCPIYPSLMDNTPTGTNSKLANDGSHTVGLGDNHCVPEHEIYRYALIRYSQRDLERFIGKWRGPVTRVQQRLTSTIQYILS